MMASAKAKKEIPVDLLECPVCMETMCVPIFLCQSGHSLCNNCTSKLVPPICPICRQPMTQMRSWKLEEIVQQVKFPCPNKELGCLYTMPKSNVDDHLKECIFREMECPKGIVFGKCSWRGQLRELSKHFMERHPENWAVNNDADMVLNNVSILDDDRRFFLVTQGKLNFIITFKLDTLQKMAYFIIQLIGNKCVAHQHIYEIHVNSNLDDRKKVIYTEHCTIDAVKVDEIIRLGKCAILPLDYLAHFIKDGLLTFRFFIKRIQSGPPKQDKENGKKPDNQGPNNGPRGPNNGPRGPNNGPRGPNNGPKGPHQGPKGHGAFPKSGKPKGPGPKPKPTGKA